METFAKLGVLILGVAVLAAIIGACSPEGGIGGSPMPFVIGLGTLFIMYHVIKGLGN